MLMNLSHQEKLVQNNVFYFNKKDTTWFFRKLVLFKSFVVKNWILSLELCCPKNLTNWKVEVKKEELFICKIIIFNNKQRYFQILDTNIYFILFFIFRYSLCRNFLSWVLFVSLQDRSVTVTKTTWWYQFYVCSLHVSQVSRSFRIAEY